MRHEDALIETVLRRFNVQGYTVTSFRPNSRHYVGTLLPHSGGVALHLKMTRLMEAAPRTENEIVWLRTMCTIQKEKDLPFKVAEIVDSGKIGDAPYFIGTYWEQPTLVSQRDFEETGRYDTTLLEDCLDRVVEIALTVSRDTWPALPLDHRWNTPQVYVDTATNVLRDIEQRDGEIPTLYPLVELACQVQTYWEVSPKIGDFDPWHCFAPAVGGDKIAIIDGEAAASVAPKFHDVAHFVARICERGDKLELAAAFIERFFSGLDRQERESFRTLGKSLIALRCLTSYWDRKDRKEHHDRLREALLSGKLIP